METTAPLPVKLMGVQYYLRPGFFSGGYTWSGDLIITSTTIYYFPVVDLEKERKERSNAPGGLIGLLISDLPKLINKKELTFFENLHNTDDSDSEVQKRLEVYFEKKSGGDDFLKASVMEDRNDVPRPMRFIIDDISNLRVGRGKLSFNSIADTHDFAFSGRETNRVRLGLEHCGYRFV